MNPKEYMKQAESLRRRKERKEQELFVLRETADGLAGVGAHDMPKTVSPDPHKIEAKVCRIVTLEAEIKKLGNELNALVSKMNNEIEHVDDDDVRDVMKKRYLEFKSWSVISKEMNFSESTCYRLHRSGLVMLEI